MSFLPDVELLCDVCGDRRFDAETLHHALSLLVDVGLGYLTPGQQSQTLSGGEAHRIKLVAELAKVRTDLRAPLRATPMHAPYVLDELTVGLHMADVEKLIRALHRPVDAGNTVMMVEHDLDVIAEADWIIDMSPEAGDVGGRIVAQAAPQELAHFQMRSACTRARRSPDFSRDGF